MGKPILCLDFDGVIHSYTNGWQGADEVSDPPVPGAMQFIADAQAEFDVQIFSSRSNQDGGIAAMVEYIRYCLEEEFGGENATAIINLLSFPTVKPPAMLTIDDRALEFTGTWPSVSECLAFKPWNKREQTDQDTVEAFHDRMNENENRND